MIEQEYIKATNKVVAFLTDKYPYAAIIAQADMKTDKLISMLVDVINEAQQYIEELKALEDKI